MKFKAIVSCIASFLLVMSLPALNADAQELPAEAQDKLTMVESGAVVEKSASEGYFGTGSNVNFQNYTNALKWGQTVSSFLCVDPLGRLVRFQNNSTEDECDYLVQYYDNNYNLTEGFLVDMELPLFGGFYSTNNYYFIVTGQENPDEDDNVEVFRITQYDKNWNRLGSDSLYGANTTKPFLASSCRMADCGDYLLIRTGHEMYKYNGVNHQANVTIEYNMKTSKITDSYTEIMNNRVGYVSHSFNQFIEIDNNSIVSVDHGDGSPRSIALLKYKTDVTTGKFVPDYFDNPCEVVNVMEFPGTKGQNYTGASIGGFEISDSSYLVAGNVVADWNNYTSSSATRNVFVASVSKSNNAVTTNMITNYQDGEKGVANPQFMKISSDRYLLLWALRNNTTTVYYTLIDGSGNQVGSIYTANASVSDCKPILNGNKVVWYSWNDDNITFNEINANNPSQFNSTTLAKGCGLFEPAPELINKSYLSTASAAANTSVTINAAAEGGKAPYRYTYSFKQSTAYDWNVRVQNTTLTSQSILFSTPGTYDIKVDVTDSQGTFSSKTMSLEIVADPLVNNSKLSASKVIQGENVTVTAAASGGSGSYKYTYYVRKASDTSWKTKAENTTQTTITLTPNYIEKYYVKVVVVDSSGTRTAKTLTLNVIQKLTNNSSLSSTAVIKGTDVKVNAAAAGGTGGYKYSYFVRRKTASSWTKKAQNTTQTSITLHPTQVDIYYVKVSVTDSSGTTVNKTLTLNVKNTLTNSSTVSSTKVKKGTTVTLYGAATGGMGGYQYSYYVKQASSSTWKSKGENVQQTSTSIKPTCVGTYDVKIIVTDSSGAKSAKTFKIQVTD